MKKHFCLKLLISVTLSLILSSCGFYTENERQEIIEMFNSFGYTDKYIVRTTFQLHVGETIVDIEDITYNGQQCEPIFLEEEGFYAYSCNEEETELNLLHIYYEDMKIELLDEFAIPSRIVNTAYLNDSFYFRIAERYNQKYIIYNMITKEITNVDTDDVDVYEGSIDNNRSTKYKLTYKDSAFGSDSVVVENKATGIKKKITKSLLNTFEEGKMIEKKRRIDPFDISKIFVEEDDFYIIGYFGLDGLGMDYFYYIWKWNFETEKAEYYTSIYITTYSGDVKDLYILR